VAALPASFSFPVRSSRFFHPALHHFGVYRTVFYIYYLALTDIERIRTRMMGGRRICPTGFPQFLLPPPDPPVSSPRSRCGKRHDACFTPASEVATDASALSVVRLSVSVFLSLSLSFSISHPDVFFCTRLGGIPSRHLRKGPVGLVRLTRVLFDYYFGTYRALVTSLCGHMVVGG